MNEFAIIQRFFTPQTLSRKDVLLGTGDDAAIISPPTDQQLVITTDTLVKGVHFPINTSAADIGFKSLAVNLSDLAAMGATPAWLTLALTLPAVDETWLTDFSRDFLTLATNYHAELIGGDLTQGPLTITVQAIGLVPTGQAIQRNTAKPGDFIYVSNTPGDAAAGLAFLQKKINLSIDDQKNCVEKLNRPIPRIQLGEQLRDIASAAIDLSDGLLADLGHILEKSGVGATIHPDQIPLSNALSHLEKDQALHFALNGGDDYELCFTVPADKKNRVPKECTCIGTITDTQTLDLIFSNGKRYPVPDKGWQHFRDDHA
ncbi:MAG TPA: thiamine-phosphate kinase [Gammaproteobacteria bacterium]|nr:thiamine-phosphate kinase [Gammaproteobacteria bacterium]